MITIDNMALKTGFASPMSSKIKQNKTMGGMGGNLKRNLRNIVALVVKKKQSDEAHGNAKLRNMAECHMIGQINNKSSRVQLT